MNRKLNTLLAATLALAIAGCATTQRTPIEDRVEGYWSAIVDNRLEDAYGFMSPGYRAAMDEEAFIARQRTRTVRWTKAELEDTSECAGEAETCSVKLRIYYEISRGVPGLDRPVELNRLVRQDWLRSNGAWYFVPDDL